MRASLKRFPPMPKAAALALSIGLAGALVPPALHAAPKPTSPPPDQLAAVERMAAYFADKLATAGGYVYAYSADLKIRRGEGGEAEPGVNWNQPPGTPAVGAAFLRLYELTDDPRWLTAAGAAADATVKGQLLSGGWYNYTETLPEQRSRWCYRVTVATPDDCAKLEDNKVRNNGTLDDNITQSNLGFLMWYDTVTKGHNADVRAAVQYGLDRLVRAQYPNGAWPVFLDRVFPHKRFAAAWRARIPKTWSREWVKPPNSAMVLNDQLVRDTMRLLLAADRYLDREDLTASARRTGDFLLAAQLPAPQRGWAQTYNLDLEPIWGRKFEPPAVASRETAGAAEALVLLYLRTGEPRYLDGAVEAADWLRKNKLPSGDWARFYELGTNKPLYVSRDDKLTYDDKSLHRGYGLVGEFGIGAILELVDQVAAGGKPSGLENWDWVFEPTPYALGETAPKLDEVDDEGRLVEDGWIRSGSFIRAVRSLGPPSVAGSP
jgi:PelA/Pel-15E family pectate lyase